MTARDWILYETAIQEGWGGRFYVEDLPSHLAEAVHRRLASPDNMTSGFRLWFRSK